MANKKQPYNWYRIKPGDIVSFRYKTEATGLIRMHSVLVLNPRFLKTLKDGSKKRQMIGIKLEGSNKIELRMNATRIARFERIGELKRIDEKNNLYKLVINENLILNDRMGIKKRAYDILSTGLGIKGQYRTYDWRKARSSAVYLEPIRIFPDEY